MNILRTTKYQLKTFLPWLLALLTGIAMSCTFPPYDRPGLAWVPFVAVAPLAGVLLFSPLPASFGKRLGVTFLLGFFSGSVFFLLTLEWVRCVAWEGLVTLPFYLALYEGVWGMFVGLVLRSFLEKGESSSLKNFFTACLAAASWSGLEWLRGTLFTGFGWNSFGVAFHHVISLIQIADVTGVSGLSFLGVMTGCSMAIASRRFVDEIRQRKITTPLRMRPHGDLLVTLLVIVMVVAYGLHEMLAPVPPQKRIRVAAIQGNISQNHKWDRAFEESIMETYCRESRAALALHPDLIVWPEAATPRPLLYDQKTFLRLEELLEQSETDFLIGSLHYEEEPQRDYNAAILLNTKELPGIPKIQYYAKSHLLPFGEYIPFRKSFPLFQWIIGDRILGDFDAGPGPKLLLLSHQEIKVAPLICFEDTLGNLVRQFALLGAQGFINMTNDGWFGHSAASKQHLVNALFRSVETKLPMLRVANTGVTCLIDRFGRVARQLHDGYGNTFFEGMMVAEWSLPENPPHTFYARHGDIFAEGCLGVMLLSIATFFLQKIRQQRKV
ncbi:MAG: apolipoprotein N-acyltransferase [Chthoniobacterales bacterium]